MSPASMMTVVASEPMLQRRADARLRGMVEAHIDAMARLLRRLGVPESDVDDAVQQVFLTAARRLGDIEPHAEKSFLYKTALHVAAHARRTVARRRESGDDGAPEQADGRPSAEELIDRRRAAALLEEVLELMPEELRTVFVLFEIEQLPTLEIAALLEVPVGTAASRLRRAREEFQERVARLRARRTRGAP